MRGLQPGCIYHIFNRGNNRDILFIEERNYQYFLRLYRKYVEPVAATYAYCLIPNHFHFLIRTRTLEEQKVWKLGQGAKTSPVAQASWETFLACPARIECAFRETFPVCPARIECAFSPQTGKVCGAGENWKPLEPSQQFSNFFNAYAKAINKAYRRRGSLFQKKFHRLIVGDDEYLKRLVFYIHNNPVKHHITKDMTSYPYSSYGEIVRSETTIAGLDKTLFLFRGRDEFIHFHQRSRNNSDFSSI